MKTCLYKKERISNFELLRLISMFLIVLHHYVVHGVTARSAVTLNNAVLSFMGSFGKIGVGMFVMLTGYFACTGKFNLKRIVLIVLELVFYDVAIYLVLCACCGYTFNVADFAKRFFPLNWSTHWFITTYIALYLFSPVLNAAVAKFKKKQLLLLCVSLFAIYFVTPVVFGGRQMLDSSNVLLFFALYLAAAYIRVHTDTVRYNKKRCVVMLVCFLAAYIALENVLFILKGKSAYAETMYSLLFYQNESPFTLLIPAVALLFCRTTKPVVSRAVNFASASTLGIYIIHDEENMRAVLWHNIFNNADVATGNVFLLIAHALGCVSAVFIGCILIDIVRRLLIERYVSVLYDKIKNKIINIKAARQSCNGEKND